MKAALEMEIIRARDLVLKLRGELRPVLTRVSGEGAKEIRAAFNSSGQLLERIDNLSAVVARMKEGA